MTTSDAAGEQPEPNAPAPGGPLAAATPAELLRSRRYIALLVLAGLVGVPVSVLAFWFLVFTTDLQKWIYQSLPSGLGLSSVPTWWPIPVLAVGGLLVAATIKYLPGRGGHSPADGFKAGGLVLPSTVPGIAIAAIVTLGSGAVLGPEAPLIALGGGIVVCAVSLARRDMPPQVLTVIASAGSFAAISTLIGSPLLGAFLLMEAAPFGGPMLSLVLLPGLLAAGVGALIFVGLGSWTGHGTFSLALPDLPHFARPDVAELGWALVVGLAAAVLGTAIHWVAKSLKPYVEGRLILLVPVIGVLVGVLALIYADTTGKSFTTVLFSGQDAMGPLVANSASYSVGALLMLVLCKSAAYGLSMSGFRGGPVFPALFIGAAGGIAMSHLPGLPLVPAVAMGIGAMSATMLKLPLSSVLLATVLLASDGLAVTPLVIVAVVVAYVVSAHLPAPPDGTAEAAGAKATPAAAQANA
jgi:H+/Cl- antiporter ClcA